MWEVSAGISSPETSMTRSGENISVSLLIVKLKCLKWKKKKEKTVLRIL